MLTINPIYTTSYSNKARSKQVSFQSAYHIESLTHTNIGSCMDGYIGKVRVRKGDNSESFLNVFKKNLFNNYEAYSIKNDNEDVLGVMEIAIKKYPMYDKHIYGSDPSHVFVSKLRNYSNPNTPFYKKGLEYHKDIGTRLMQIAQRRSDETCCGGNIRLISKNESKRWYKDVIGMVEEFTLDSSQPRWTYVSNPNAMYIPPHAKEPLSRLQGGL